MNTTRRVFLGHGLAAAGVVGWTGLGAERAWRAAVIGATGKGDYGHGMDVVFHGLPGVVVAGVADPHAEGREKAKARIGAGKAYADFRELLALEKPGLVSVAPRWTEEHFAMIGAALEAGAHVLAEKPFTTSLEEADQLLALARRRGLKIGVAHQMRLAPNVRFLREEMRRGLIGDLVQMRAYGKQDRRAGGEDMVVLGTHLFDMMQLFAGEARECTASVWQGGKPARREDRKRATEGIGWVLGDEIEARFEFDNRVMGFFTSRASMRETIGRWRLELIGTKGRALILMDIDPDVKTAAGAAEDWRVLRPLEAEEKGTAAANRRMALDWLNAIEQGREPVCSGENAMRAIEMVMAVYEAGISGARVELPLARRKHPLEI